MRKATGSILINGIYTLVPLNLVSLLDAHIKKPLICGRITTQIYPSLSLFGCVIIANLQVLFVLSCKCSGVYDNPIDTSLGGKHSVPSGSNVQQGSAKKQKTSPTMRTTRQQAKGKGIDRGHADQVSNIEAAGRFICHSLVGFVHIIIYYIDIYNNASPSKQGRWTMPVRHLACECSMFICQCRCNLTPCIVWKKMRVVESNKEGVSQAQSSWSCNASY